MVRTILEYFSFFSQNRIKFGPVEKGEIQSKVTVVVVGVLRRLEKVRAKFFRPELSIFEELRFIVQLQNFNSLLNYLFLLISPVLYCGPPRSAVCTCVAEPAAKNGCSCSRFPFKLIFKTINFNSGSSSFLVGCYATTGSSLLL